MEALGALGARLTARLGRLEAPPSSDPSLIHAAVMLLLREAGNGAEILIIERAEREGDPWSGRLALPGGRAEPIDATLLDAAVRETREEVGVDLRDGGRVLGRLPTVLPLSVRLPPIDVTPFVALAPPGLQARAEPSEVQEAFWLSLDELHRRGPTDVVTRVIRGEPRRWRAYQTPRGPIWGITERILSTFLELCP